MFVIVTALVKWCVSNIHHIIFFQIPSVAAILAFQWAGGWFRLLKLSLPLPLSPRFVYCLFPLWNFALKPLLAAATALSPKLSPKLPLFWWISFSAALGCRCHFVCQEVLQTAKQVFFWILFGVTRRKKGTGEACRNATCRYSIKGTRGDRGRRRGRNRRRRGRSKGSLAARVKLAFLTFARRIFHCLRACGDTVTTNSLWSLCLADFFRRVGTHNLLRAFLLPILQSCNDACDTR